MTCKTEDAAIYLLDTRELEEKQLFAEQYARMSALRREKTDAHHTGRGRRQSLGAGIVLAHGLAQYGLQENEVRMWVV